MDCCFDTLFSETKKIPMADCGKSFLALNFMLPIASAFSDEIAFVGDHSLTGDRIETTTNILKKHGVAFSQGNLKIRRRDRGKFEEIMTLSGHLQYGHYSMNGNEDPWFLAGLLFALPLLEGNSSVRTTTMPESTELAEMAVGVLKEYGIYIDASVDEYGYPYYDIPGSQKYRIPDEISIDRDWTGAAFWLGCGALGGNVTVKGLSPVSSQVSRQILDKLHTMGAAAGMGEGGANVTAASLNSCNISGGRIPELLPVLSVALASASGTSTLTDIGGVDPQPIVNTLNSLGAEVSCDGSTIRFNGLPVLSGGDIDPGEDPVSIMVAAAASCICSEAVLIRNAGIINKYYPGFFDEFIALGGRTRVLP